MFVRIRRLSRALVLGLSVLLMSSLAVACNNLQSERVYEDNYVPLHDHGIRVSGECPSEEEIIEADKYIWMNDVRPAMGRGDLTSEQYVNTMETLGGKCVYQAMHNSLVGYQEGALKFATMHDSFCRLSGERFDFTTNAEHQSRLLHRQLVAAYLVDPSLYATGINCSHRGDRYDPLYAQDYSLWLSTQEGYEWYAETKPESIARLDGYLSR